MSFTIPTLVSLFLLALPTTLRVLASPCVTFDASFNLLVFGLDGKDWNAGTQGSWSSSTPATDITTTGRPPFDGTNTTCYLAQFFNTVYVMNGDSSSPSSVHIYDAGTKSWSEQAVQTGLFDPSSFDAILDHDTNVFYALSHGEMLFLDMQQMTVANSTPIAWTDVGQAPYPAGYVPVMALAQNHIYFLDVPGVPAGSADIFVIHFSFFQPAAQPYSLSNGSAFPATHGRTASFFQSAGVQQEFAFVPDDGSATYVINVESNTTQALAGPPVTHDASASYAASITALVQLDSAGSLSFLAYQEGNDAANAASAWATVANVAAAAPPGSSSSASPSGTGASSAGSSGKPSPTSSAGGASSGNSTSSGGTQKSGVAGAASVSFILLAGLLGAAACLL